MFPALVMNRTPMESFVELIKIDGSVSQLPLSIIPCLSSDEPARLNLKLIANFLNWLYELRKRGISSFEFPLNEADLPNLVFFRFTPIDCT